MLVKPADRGFLPSITPALLPAGDPAEKSGDIKNRRLYGHNYHYCCVLRQHSEIQENKKESRKEAEGGRVIKTS
jgi:hypothetical protein